MAPIKFEENIKNKLDKRTIEPSDNAWNKLADRLEAQEEKSNAKYVWWIGIAASLVGVFLVTTLFVNKNEDEKITPTLVDMPIKDVIDVKSETEMVANNEDSKFNEKVNQEAVKVVEPKQKEIKKTERKINKPFKTNDRIVANDVKTETEQREQLINTPLTNNNENDYKALAQANKIKADKDLNVDSEIDLLLNNAKNDIAQNRLKEENIKILDANSLLEDVETDLDQSFRDKMFNTIISSYNTVKTAVAERND